MAAQAEETRRFAFGANEQDGCECPALAAGLDPSMGGFYGLLEQYDMLASHQPANHRNPSSHGTLPEREAREAWQEAIEVVADNYPEDAAGVRDKGCEVMQALGWA